MRLLLSAAGKRDAHMAVIALKSKKVSVIVCDEDALLA